MRGDKRKRKADSDDSDESDEEMRRAAASFMNKRARAQYEKQKASGSETNGMGKARNCRPEDRFDREYYRPRPKLWTPYQHPDIRVVGDPGRWC